jgi:hypothetical protein
VLDGTAHVERQSGAGGTAFPVSQAELRSGETLHGDGADPTRYFITQQIAEDSWDRWNEDLDQAAAAEAGQSTAVRDNYAGAQGYGWSDLDANGSWYDVPGQGPVWQPQDAYDDAAFDPYGNGAWAWYPASGYVWASGYSWGWTPYRCGNWSYFNSFGWGWAPGAGCGGFGWGFLGGGFPVNILLPPRGYRPIRVPVAGPGPNPIHPILPTHGASARPATAAVASPGPRRIGGVTVMPIEPVGSGFVSGSGAVGASLRRDFPIDATTRTPVLGLPSARTAAIHTATGWHSPGPASAVVHPAYAGQSHPAAVARPAPASPQFQRPVQSIAPVQHGSPPPAPRPSYAPPPHVSAPAPHVSAPAAAHGHR